MPHENKLLTAFNSGVFTPLMFGRVDFRRFGYALEEGVNYLSTPQGVALAAPGTDLMGLARDQTKRSWLTPWIFSDEQTIMLEWADLKLRFWDNSGLVLEAAKAVVTAAPGSGDLDIEITGHGWTTGDSVFLAGFEAAKNLNGRVGTITVVDPNNITVAVPPPATVGSVASATVARVYEVTTPYAAVDTHAIRLVRQLDETYVYCGEKAGDRVGYAVRKLTRLGTTSWTLAEAVLEDGPYLDADIDSARITPGSTGSPVPKMTSNTAPAGNTASADSESGGNLAFHAFDQDADTVWSGTTNQSGHLQIQLASAATVTGYAIHARPNSPDLNYASTDYAPSTWKLEGSNDGSTWTLLDRQVDFVAYEKRRTPYIRIKNGTAFLYFRLTIDKLVGNGGIAPVISQLNLGITGASVTLTASSVDGINGGSGFQTTDVGRLIRVRGSDLNWRPLRITARTSTTVVDADLEGEPFASLDPALEFRMGMFSDTTGHPATAVRFKARQNMGGVRDYPSFVIGSEAQTLDKLAPSEEDGLVTDASGYALEIDHSEVADIRWLVAFDKNRGVLVGTGSGIFNLTRTDTSRAFSGTNLDQDPADSTWTSRVEPLKVRQAVLHLAQDQRNLFELAHSFQDDGFVPRNLSLFATHLSSSQKFEQLAYVQQPYPIVVLRRADGDLMFVTYDRSEDVLGWFEYRPGEGGEAADVESIAVLPDASNDQHLIWMQVLRTMGGVQRRTIERLAPVWREGFTSADTHFVQAGIRYSGAAATDFYGLYHYEGATVAGLADGAPITPVVVANGMITLPEAAAEVVIGLGFDAYAETVSLEAGAAQGTAQGRSKRVHEVDVLLFESQTGSLGKRVDDALVYEEIEYRTSTDVLGAMPAPFTGFKRVDGLSGHDIKATIAWRRDGDKPLPFHVVALIPNVETRG